MKDQINQTKVKKSFYDLLWSLCEDHNMIEVWMNEGLLGKSRDTYYWTAKAQNRYNYTIVGERKGSDLERQQSKLTPAQRAKQREEEFHSKVSDNKLEEFITLFSSKNLGVSGKRTPKITVVKKLIKFFEDYPMYTMDNIINATKMYIEDHKKNGSIKYIRECGYFISKKIDGIDQSDLAKWCDEAQSGGQSYTSRTIL
jgi:hypothetical protein